MKFRMEGGAGDKLFTDICADFARGVDTEELVGPNETPAFDKYDEYVPSELLRRAYVKERLRTDEIAERAKNGWNMEEISRPRI
jgi:ATP-dependent Lhr-like helicase